MHMRRLLTGVMAVSGTILNLAALAEAPPGTAGTATVQIQKMSDWMGREVKDQQGNSVGDINDFAINLSDASITYAVVELEGMFNSKRIAVPLAALESSPGNTRTLTLAASTEQWQAAPTFDAGTWPANAVIDTNMAVSAAKPVPSKPMDKATPLGSQDPEIKNLAANDASHPDTEEVPSGATVAVPSDSSALRSAPIASSELAAVQTRAQNEKQMINKDAPDRASDQQLSTNDNHSNRQQPTK